RRRRRTESPSGEAWPTDTAGPRTGKGCGRRARRDFREVYALRQSIATREPDSESRGAHLYSRFSTSATIENSPGYQDIIICKNLISFPGIPTNRKRVGGVPAADHSVRIN